MVTLESEVAEVVVGEAAVAEAAEVVAAARAE